MKRIGTALRAAVSLGLCAALLAGCSLLPSDPAPEQPVPTDPLTGQEQLWPGQRPVAVSIENASDSTTQWGLSAGVRAWVLRSVPERRRIRTTC